jgi:hypothetical protein
VIQLIGTIPDPSADCRIYHLRAEILRQLDYLSAKEAKDKKPRVVRIAARVCLPDWLAKIIPKPAPTLTPTRNPIPAFIPASSTQRVSKELPW